jgi:threonine dehydrogenase-like Zn-dependent dehydrogenase
MLAVVTEGVDAIRVRERPDPEVPGPGQVMLRPEAIGICGSDFLSGELSEPAGGSQFPRVQGHEVAARITAVGPHCRKELKVDQPVALYPLRACGRCYPCQIGRGNACENFELIGIHVDGGLQERLILDQDQVFPIDVGPAAVVAMTEPVSIAVRAVNRAAVQEGEHAVVMGAGPIGQCIGLVTRERGAEVLIVDLQERRLRVSRELGAQTLKWESADQVVSFARRWAGNGGPPVVFDATGSPTAVRAMIDMAAAAGRAVQVGMSPAEVPIRIGSMTEKELDLLGVSCCTDREFAEAVGVVERNSRALVRLISHEFGLEQAPEALRFAMSNPHEVMKVVIRGG